MHRVQKKSTLIFFKNKGKSCAKAIEVKIREHCLCGVRSRMDVLKEKFFIQLVVLNLLMSNWPLSIPIFNVQFDHHVGYACGYAYYSYSELGLQSLEMHEAKAQQIS